MNDHHHLAVRWVFVRLPPQEAPRFSLPYATFQKEATEHSPHVRSMTFGGWLCVDDLFLLCFLIYSCLDTSVDLQMVILYFVLEYSAALLVLVTQTLLSLALGSTFTWLWVLRRALVTMGIGFLVFGFLFCLIFEHFLPFWCSEISRLILDALPVPNGESAIFSQELWFPWLENDIRNQAVGVRCACYHCGFVASGPSVLTEQGNMCINTNPFLYTYPQILPYVTLGVCVKLRMSPYPGLQL